MYTYEYWLKPWYPGEPGNRWYFKWMFILQNVIWKVSTQPHIHTQPPSVLPKYNLFPLMITLHTPKKSWFSRGFIFGEHRKGRCLIIWTGHGHGILDLLIINGSSPPGTLPTQDPLQSPVLKPFGSNTETPPSASPHNPVSLPWKTIGGNYGNSGTLELPHFQQRWSQDRTKYGQRMDKWKRTEYLKHSNSIKQ